MKNDIAGQIEGISDKDELLCFIQRLIDDFRNNPHEWENKSIDEYLEGMLSWIEDFSDSEFNDIKWNNFDYSTMAKILYMGKIYE